MWIHDRRYFHGTNLRISGFLSNFNDPKQNLHLIIWAMLNGTNTSPGGDRLKLTDPSSRRTEWPLRRGHTVIACKSLFRSSSLYVSTSFYLFILSWNFSYLWYRSYAYRSILILLSRENLLKKSARKQRRCLIFSLFWFECVAYHRTIAVIIPIQSLGGDRNILIGIECSSSIDDYRAAICISKTQTTSNSLMPFD